MNATRSRRCVPWGFDRFNVAGHDRGGRCAYRLALDFPQAGSSSPFSTFCRPASISDAPTCASHLVIGHRFFFAQPFPLPERLISADPELFYFREVRNRDHFAPEALAEYLRVIRDPATVHAMCEDYRAGATFDFALDEADRGRRRITCPVLALWEVRAR